MIDEPDTILYLTVDSLRKDAVTAETMPYLYSLAEDGVWFDDMHATAPATAASFVGLMASRYYDDVDGIGLPDEELVTLAEALPSRYETVGYSTNQFTSAYYNYDRGFDEFSSPSQGWKFKIRRHLDEDGWLFNVLERSYQWLLMAGGESSDAAPSYFNTPAETVNDWALNRLGEAPLFMWLHHMDVHHPLEPPGEYLPDSVESRRQAQALSRGAAGRIPDGVEVQVLRDLYAAECRYWDDEFKRLHQRVPEDTLTVVVGDHGELLGEHDRYGHPHEMWRELVTVPCVIHHPDLEAGDVRGIHSTIDLPATLVDLAGGTVPVEMRGRPLDPAAPEPRALALGNIETADNVGFARSDEYKWVRHRSRRSTQDEHGELLFETEGDETVPVGRENADEHPGVVQSLREKYEETVATGPVGTGRRFEDEQVRQHMADLGYLQQQ